MDFLQINSQCKSVQQLQNKLIDLGFTTITADGIFGPSTQTAVKHFQQSKNLIADGIVGVETLKALGYLPNEVAAMHIKGIDISHNNGVINWATLSTEVGFVYCKASEGSTFKDHCFNQNFNKLGKANIIRGGYHFLNFRDSVDLQIANFLTCKIDYTQKNILPPVLDVEMQVSRVDNEYIKANRGVCIQLVADWLSAVQKKTGRVPMIYTNPSFWSEFLGNPKGFESYLLWISEYNSSPSKIPGWSDYTIWQNSGRGAIDSVAGNVDTDIFNGPMDDLLRLAAPAPHNV